MADPRDPRQQDPRHPRQQGDTNKARPSKAEVEELVDIIIATGMIEDED